MLDIRKRICPLILLAFLGGRAAAGWLIEQLVEGFLNTISVSAPDLCAGHCHRFGVPPSP